MARELWAYKSSRAIQADHPIEEISMTPLSFSGTGSTASFKVYDPGKDEVLTVAAIGTDTVINVSNVGAFVDADTIEVQQDDGTFHAATISSIDLTAGTITITPGLASGAAVDNRFRKIFGTAVAMAEYGLPKVDTLDWGFIGTYLSTHPSQILEQDIDVEITVVGDPGNPGTMDALQTLCATIKNERDCRGC